VQSGGPADRAGIERGDVIVSFEGKKIREGAQLQNEVAMTEPGTQVKLEVIRDGETKEITVELKERGTEGKPEDEGTRKPGDQDGGRLGISVQTLTPEIAGRLGYKGESGVVITAVQPGSPAAGAGLRRGDLIQEVNRNPVASVEDLKEELDDVESGDTAALLIRRGQNTFFAAVEIQ